MQLFNEYFLIKRVAEHQGEIALASVVDNFSYMGEVVEVPLLNQGIEKGDVVIFLKGEGDDVEIKGDKFKVVKVNQIIMKL